MKKMYIPKCVNIMGETYTISPIKDLAESMGKYGYCDPKKKEIAYEQTLENEDLLHTLIHEISHAQGFETGLYQAISHEILEVIAETGATNLLRLCNVTFKRAKK